MARRQEPARAVECPGEEEEIRTQDRVRLLDLDTVGAEEEVREGTDRKRSMPSKNFHSCDINTSLKVVGSMRRSYDGKPYSVRVGVLKGKGGSKEHSYSYSKEIWTAAKARVHCKAHGGRFAAALKE